MRALLLNAPSGYRESLGELPEGVRLDESPRGAYGFVQVFVKDSAEFTRWIETARQALEYDGLM